METAGNSRHHKRALPDAPELELLSSESESEDEELLSSESDDEELLSESDEDASRFLRFLEPFFLSSSPPAAAPRASGSSSLGSRNRGRACRNNQLPVARALNLAFPQPHTKRPQLATASFRGTQHVRAQAHLGVQQLLRARRPRRVARRVLALVRPVARLCAQHLESVAASWKGNL